MTRLKMYFMIPGLLLSISCFAQGRKDVMLLGFYGGQYMDGTTTNPNIQSVPCPADPYGQATNTWFYDQLAKEANLIAGSGFTSVWLPPMSKGGYGSGRFGGIYDVGYGLFDHYDLGDKLQNNSYQTRYGSRTQLTRLIAMLKANGLAAYEDLVTNQVSIFANVTPQASNNYLWYQYKDAYGNPSGGRFPKYTTDFHNPPNGKPGSPGGPQDPDVPATTYPNGSSTGGTEGYFGPDFAHITGQSGINNDPYVWCYSQLGLWGDWLVRATGIDGYRLDDASGISWDFLKPLTNYGAMKGKYSVTELAGSKYGANEMQQWMQTSMGRSDSNFTMFDQLLQGTLNTMCKTNQFYARALTSSALAYGSVNNINPAAGTLNPGSLDIYRSLMVSAPNQSVTVLNEIDSESGNTDVSPKQSLIGYAYILTIGFGTPCIPYRDWSTDAGSYGGVMIDSHNLNYHLNKLIWCHNFIISGGLSNEYVNSNAHVYGFQKTGGKQAIVLLNTDQNNSNTVTMPTSIANGTVLIDYTDHNITTTVANNAVTVTVPANQNGRGYLVLAPPGITGSFNVNIGSVTQEWDASRDLSIPPATGTAQEVCRIWVDANQNISTTLLDFNTNNWSPDTKLSVEIDRSTLDNKVNIPLANRTYTANQKNQPLIYNTSQADGPGYYSIWVTGTALPDQKTNWWFNLQSTYTASQTAPADFNDTIPTLTTAIKPYVLPTQGANSMGLYPNPVHSSLTFTCTLQASATVTTKLYDWNGRLVNTYSPYVIPAGTSSKTVDVSRLTNGIYLLVFQTSDGQLYTEKFIKN